MEEPERSVNFVVHHVPPYDQVRPPQEQLLEQL
jgi:hypothetical protein